MKQKLNFALIGAGAIAQTYAQAFAVCETAQLVAVADTRAEAARAFGEKMNCRSYDSHRALLDAEAEIDAVIVCTPPATHPQICRDFFAHKINVLCEKPLCIDSQSARELIAAAQKAGVTLTMASKFRYVADVTRARELIASGAIGEVILFENAFTSHVDMRERWNSDPLLSGGGVLIDNGTHSVDIMRYFLGPLRDVQVVEGKRSQGLPVEETVRLFARSAAGALGSVDLSWSINKALENYINIYGTDGAIRVGWRESKYRNSETGGDWKVFGAGYDKVQAFRSQIENFSRHLADGEELVITAEDALASVEVVEAAYVALERDAWTPVNGARELAFSVR